MDPSDQRTGESSYRPNDAPGKPYLKLYLRFILLTLLCSVLPLLLASWAMYTNYAEFYQSRLNNSFLARAEYYRKMVELFLKERTSDLKLINNTHSLNQLTDQEQLAGIFSLLETDGAHFTDLGIINDRGRHLSYVGPYDLMQNDYSVTFWFKEVMRGGPDVYVSDIFMGYRKVPHFIMATLRTEGERRWILRATIYGEFLNSLIKGTAIGDTGEVYLVNQYGFYQTLPRFGGALMARASLPMDRFTGGSGVITLEPESENGGQDRPKELIAYAWLEKPRWMIVAKQDYSEAFAEVNSANRAALILLHTSLFAILAVTALTTRHMIKVIKKRDEEAEHLNRQVLQTSKMASIGQLAAGVAHEVNNPLAVILTDTQIGRDLIDDQGPALEEGFKQDLIATLSQIDAMVERCRAITQKLLRFSRRAQETVQAVDVNVCLNEVVSLLERHANTAGVELSVNFAQDLPGLTLDPFELQQVFINIIGNAIDAHEGKPDGLVKISIHGRNDQGVIEVRVQDAGWGISQENLGRIFDPFYTTKPVGRGNGLGLSISYGIIRQLGGDIVVKSKVGSGTEFIIRLPIKPLGNAEQRIVVTSGV